VRSDLVAGVNANRTPATAIGSVMAALSVFLMSFRWARSQGTAALREANKYRKAIAETLRNFVKVPQQS